MNSENLDQTADDLIKIDEEMMEKLIALGKLNYPLSKCISVLELPVHHIEEFSRLFNLKGSTVQSAYQTGADLSDFEIDSRVYQLAKSGDLKAVELFNKTKLKYRNKG